MLKYSNDIVVKRDRYFNDYSNQHPLTPLHFIVDLGSNSFMKSIIISVQIQYVDFQTTGFQRRTFTDKLYTIEALNEEQFIHFLYSCKDKHSEDIQTKIKKLMFELDKDWVKQRKKGIKQSQKDKSKKNTENESENTENESKNTENENEMEIDDNKQENDDVENIENERNNLNLNEINCIGSGDKMPLINIPDTETCDEGKLILTKEYEEKLKKLQTIELDYNFDHLIPNDESKDESIDELDFKFEYEELDNFDHNNWVQCKFIDATGKVIRRFMSRKTADKVRHCTVKSMAKNSLQTEVWKFDNHEMLQLEKSTLADIESGANKKIVYTSEEDEAKAARRKLVLNKFQPKHSSMDVDEEIEDVDEDEQDKNRNKKRGRPTKEIVKIIFDNTFAHLVTSDGGLLYF